MNRSDIEDFLYHEAYLLDSWKLEEWAELFTADGQYLIPPIDNPDSDPGTDLFLVYDDRHRLTERAKRLLKRAAHAEFPRSVLSRMIGNVRMEKSDREEHLRAYSSFVVYRSRNGEMQIFPGRAIYDLRIDGEGIKIRRKRVIVDSDSLRLQGRVSIIL